MNKKEVLSRLSAKESYDFQDLREIMELLRSEGGCPWDIEQTHKSIRSCMIEEAYEVVEAIDTENPVLLREELGDVLFQVMFHSRIEEENGRFDVSDVIHDIAEKMIHRHPHVFSDVEVADSEAVLNRWEAIKTEEKQRVTLSSRLRAVPPMLPALMRASKIVKKAGQIEGVTAEDVRTAVDGLDAKGDGQAVGELLLATVRYAASKGIDAEQMLGQAVERVIREVEAEEKIENT